MFILVRNTLGEDIYVNADNIFAIQPTYRYTRGEQGEMRGAVLRMSVDFTIQVMQSPGEIMALIERAREAV